MPLELYSKEKTLQRRFSNYQLTSKKVDGLPSTGSPSVSIFDRTVGGSLEGYKNPDWRRAVRTGNEATTPMIASDSKITNQEGRLVFVYRAKDPNNSYRWTTFGYERYGTCGVSLNSGPPTSANMVGADDEARRIFQNNYSEQLRAFQGGVALGELAETLRMIRNPFRKLYDATHDYARRLSKGKRLGKSAKRSFLRDTWLEYQFGVNPLISDIESGREALKRSRNFLSERKFIRGTYWVENPHQLGSWQTAGTGFYGLQYRLRTEHTGLVSYYGVLERKVDSLAAYYANQWGFNPLRDFVPTAWELVPWSFLVDYFTNVGDVINSWSLQRQNLKWASRVIVKRSFYRTVDFLDTRDAYYKLWNDHLPAYYLSRQLQESSFVAPMWIWETKTVNRSWHQKGVALQIPELRWELPGNSTKWLNIAALSKAFRRLTPF